MPEIKQRRFTVERKTKDDNDVEQVQTLDLAVRKPTLEEIQKGTEESNRAFGSAVKSGAPVRFEIERILQERKIWTPEKKAEYERLTKEIDEGEKKILRGGIKLDEAYKVALSVIDSKNKRALLDADRHLLNQHTAEGQSEQARFNYLVSVCLVYPDTNKPYYDNVSAYLDDANKGIEPAQIGAKYFSAIQYNLDPEAEHKQVEIKFLKKYGFMDEKLRLLEKRNENNGRFKNLDGKTINDKGNLINEKNELIDTNGNVVTEAGELVPVEPPQPFLDEDVAITPEQ